MISKVIWNPGGVKAAAIGTWKLRPISGTVYDWHKAERKEEVYSGRSTTWDGYIWIIYPSDYGFSKNWLASSTYTWTMTTDCDNEKDAYCGTNKETVVRYGTIYDILQVLHVLYLKPEIKIISGTGTNTDPFLLAL